MTPRRKRIGRSWQKGDSGSSRKAARKYGSEQLVCSFEGALLVATSGFPRLPALGIVRCDGVEPFAAFAIIRSEK